MSNASDLVLAKLTERYGAEAARLVTQPVVAQGDLQLSHDGRVVTIFGVRYDIELLRHLGVGPIGSCIRLVNREDGVVTLQNLTPAMDAYDEAMRAQAIPREPLEVYDSNSWRRVDLKREFKTVLAPTVHSDGQPDIIGTDLLRAMVAAFNAMLELRRAP